MYCSKTGGKRYEKESAVFMPGNAVAALWQSPGWHGFSKDLHPINEKRRQIMKEMLKQAKYTIVTTLMTGIHV